MLFNHVLLFAILFFVFYYIIFIIEKDIYPYITSTTKIYDGLLGSTIKLGTTKISIVKVIRALVSSNPNLNIFSYKIEKSKYLFSFVEIKLNIFTYY